MTQPAALSRPWTANYEPGVPHDYQPDHLTLVDLLKRTAQRFPDRVAMEFLGRRTTYRQLWQEAGRLATALQGMGLQPGERVSVMLPNCPQFVVSFYGVLLAGGVVVNTCHDPACRPFPSLDRQL